MTTMEAAASVDETPCFNVTSEDSVPTCASASQTCLSTSVQSSVGGGDADSVQSDAGCVTSSPVADSAWDNQNNWASLATELEQAVLDGNVECAKHLVTLLAEKRAQIQVAILAMQPNQQDQQISIKLHVEDKDHEALIMIDVSPFRTIRELKQMIRWKYSFPVQVQRWIIGKRLPKDHETLEACGVRTSGTSVYLYLVSSRSVGLTRAEFQAEEQRQAEMMHQGQDVAVSSGVTGNVQQSAIPATHSAINHPLQQPANQQLLGAVGGVQEDHAVVKNTPPPRPPHPPVHSPSQTTPPTPPTDASSPAMVAPFGAERRPVNPVLLTARDKIKSTSKSLKDGVQRLKHASNKGPTHALVASVEDNTATGTTDQGRANATALGLNMTDTLAAVDAILEPSDVNNATAAPLPALPTLPSTSNGQGGVCKDGWSCSTCTYINLPTRPGCKMCTTARPENYYVPQSYNIPDEERRRLIQEKQYEQQAREAESDQDQDTDVIGEDFEHLRLTEQDMQTLIQLNTALQQKVVQSASKNTSRPDALRALAKQAGSDIADITNVIARETAWNQRMQRDNVQAETGNVPVVPLQHVRDRVRNDSELEDTVLVDAKLNMSDYPKDSDC